jgi:hypothetical protein
MSDRWAESPAAISEKSVIAFMIAFARILNP